MVWRVVALRADFFHLCVLYVACVAVVANCVLRVASSVCNRVVHCACVVRSYIIDLCLF